MAQRSLLLLFLAACSTPTPTSTVKPETPPGIQAENAEWAKIAEEAIRSIPVAEQKQLVEADAHYHLALAAYNRADFDKAKEQAQRAIQLWPEHLAARHLLNDVNEIIVGGPTRLRGIGDRELQVCRITVDQARIEITNHILNGGRYLDAQLYSKALREFEDAEFKIVNLPDYVTTMNDLLPKVRAMKARAKSSIRD